MLKIVSGGQTGVDRAGLDSALAHGLPIGGWCPLGRLAEDGPIPEHYPLQETNTPKYWFRTRQNVIDSDATLIISPLPLSGGTELTLKMCRQEKRPCLVVDVAAPLICSETQAWLARERISTLNIAGPRESTYPGIYNQALAILDEILRNAI